MIINEKQSFDIFCQFLDEANKPVIPETLIYTLQTENGTCIRTETVTANKTSYTIPITVEDNTLGENKGSRRKVIVDWTYNGGDKGDSIKVGYTIQPL